MTKATQQAAETVETFDLCGWEFTLRNRNQPTENAVIAGPHGYIGLTPAQMALLRAILASTQERTHYIAIGPLCWGRAEKQEAAIRNMRKQNSGRMPRDYTVYKCTAGTYVNDMGGFTRNGFDAEPIKVFSTKGIESLCPKEPGAFCTRATCRCKALGKPWERI